MEEGSNDILDQLRSQIASLERSGVHVRSDEGTPSPRLRNGRDEHRPSGAPSAQQPSAPDGTEAAQAFRKIERLSLVKERASLALRRRLVREGFSEDATNQALERAVRCGLVDDLRFAETLMRCRAAMGRGRQGIEAELSRLGIEASDVSGWPDEFVGGEDDEIPRAIALLDKRPPKAKNLRDAAYRRLLQKGYSSSTASSASRLWLERRQDESQDR